MFVCVNGYPFDRLNEIRLFIRSVELSAEPTQLNAEKIEENKNGNGMALPTNQMVKKSKDLVLASV